MKKIRSSQAAIPCTELSKTLVKQSFSMLVSLRKVIKDLIVKLDF